MSIPCHLYVLVLIDQINYLGPMLLTLELLPVLVSTAETCGDGRIALVSSKANTSADSVEVDRLIESGEESHSRFRTYCNSKLYNVSLCGEGREFGLSVVLSVPQHQISITANFQVFQVPVLSGNKQNKQTEPC